MKSKVLIKGRLVGTYGFERIKVAIQFFKEVFVDTENIGTIGWKINEIVTRLESLDQTAEKKHINIVVCGLLEKYLFTRTLHIRLKQKNIEHFMAFDYTKLLVPHMRISKFLYRSFILSDGLFWKNKHRNYSVKREITESLRKYGLNPAIPVGQIEKKVLIGLLLEVAQQMGVKIFIWDSHVAKYLKREMKAILQNNCEICTVTIDL